MLTYARRNVKRIRNNKKEHITYQEVNHIVLEEASDPIVKVIAPKTHPPTNTPPRRRGAAEGGGIHEENPRRNANWACNFLIPSRKVGTRRFLNLLVLSKEEEI